MVGDVAFTTDFACCVLNLSDIRPAVWRGQRATVNLCEKVVSGGVPLVLWDAASWRFSTGVVVEKLHTRCPVSLSRGEQETPWVGIIAPI